MSDEQLDALSAAQTEATRDQAILSVSRARRVRRKNQVTPTSADKSGLDTTSRWFFPCNREDALVLLGSLFISPAFFLNSVRLAVQSDGIAILADGLNKAEEELLTGGRQERFPLLVEVDASVADQSPRTITLIDVVRLVFRNKQEADDFQFRPVEEFDTEALKTEIEPGLFGREGAARFTIRPALDESDVDLGYIADRFVAGIQAMISLGRGAEDLVPAIRDFLTSRGGDAHGESLDFDTACIALQLRTAHRAPSRRQAAIASAFANDEGRGARGLVEGIARRLAAGERSDDEAHQETRWESVAHDVLRGRIELDGNHVSDDGSILLRGALLGVVADKPASLIAFLRASKPAGRRVTILASFLAGLKRGVLQTSWKEKKVDASWMSLLLRDVIIRSVGSTAEEQLVTVNTVDADGHSLISVVAAGQEVAAWNIERAVVEGDLVKEWQAAFAGAGYEVLGPGRTPHSWIVELAPGQHVEVSYAETNKIRFPMLRYHFESGVRFKKIKEVSNALDHGTMFWHKVQDDSGENYLYCDLPTLPTDQSRTLLSAKLTEAISLSTIPKRGKSNRKRAAKAGNAKPLQTIVDPAALDTASDPDLSTDADSPSR
jgi:hypothetical protein